MVWGSGGNAMGGAAFALGDVGVDTTMCARIVPPPRVRRTDLSTVVAEMRQGWRGRATRCPSTSRRPPAILRVSGLGDPALPLGGWRRRHGNVAPGALARGLLPPGPDLRLRQRPHVLPGMVEQRGRRPAAGRVRPPAAPRGRALPRPL